MRFRVSGLGFRVSGFGFRVWDIGCREPASNAVRSRVAGCAAPAIGGAVEVQGPPWSRVEGNLPQMPPLRGGMCIGVD